MHVFPTTPSHPLPTFPKPHKLAHLHNLDLFSPPFYSPVTAIPNMYYAYGNEHPQRVTGGKSDEKDDEGAIAYQYIPPSRAAPQPSRSLYHHPVACPHVHHHVRHNIDIFSIPSLTKIHRFTIPTTFTLTMLTLITPILMVITTTTQLLLSKLLSP